MRIEFFSEIESCFEKISSDEKASLEQTNKPTNKRIGTSGPLALQKIEAPSYKKNETARRT